MFSKLLCMPCGKRVGLSVVIVAFLLTSIVQRNTGVFIIADTELFYNLNFGAG